MAFKAIHQLCLRVTLTKAELKELNGPKLRKNRPEPCLGAARIVYKCQSYSNKAYETGNGFNTDFLKIGQKQLFILDIFEET